AVMVRVGEAATTAVPPAPARRFPRWAAAVLLILLLLLVGGLYGRELFAPTAVSPAHTPTTAAVAVLPTDAPTASPTSTATLPAVTATPTATTAAAGQNSDATGTAVSAAASPSPTSSPTPVVTSSPTPVGVHIVRQLVYMRSGPAINFRIVEYLTQGTAVTVLGRTESGEWYNVQLEDGRSGWVFSEMVAATDGEALGIPLVGTIPAPTDEFYNFVAQRTEDGLTITVGHVYAGTAGPEGMFLARLLPETDLIQPTYENGQALGLGDFVVHFARVAEGEYTSTAVQLCMASTAGVEFFCETFPLRRQW
ncbi:MAG TPA: SH3 domain-containing protein, partial [Chloroflexota bacterium]|nr:SH3 domain-containing protein [Chloroflexota bacterium]